MPNKLRIILTGLFALVLLINSCSTDKSNTPVITIPDSTPDPEISFIIQNICGDSIQQYVQTLENFGTRFALADNRKEVALAILKKIREFWICRCTVGLLSTC